MAKTYNAPTVKNVEVFAGSDDTHWNVTITMQSLTSDGWVDYVNQYSEAEASEVAAVVGDSVDAFEIFLEAGGYVPTS